VLSKTGVPTLVLVVSGVLAYVVPIPDRSGFASAAAYTALVYLAGTALTMAAADGPEDDEPLTTVLVAFGALCALVSPASSFVGSLGPAVGATAVLALLMWLVSRLSTARRARVPSDAGHG
jgi:di/tricarboxylate transporter